MSKSDNSQNIIVLRSVFGKVGQHYYINPAKDKTGKLPDCVKRVNSAGDMVGVSDEERNNGQYKYFIPENAMFDIQDGKTFNLQDPYEKNIWEAIKNCPFIAPSRYAKDENGNNLIDGTMSWDSKNPRYGIAELYIDMPGVETANKISRKKKIHQASEYIFNDERGSDGRLLKARLLGKNMKNMPDADIEDYLLSVAEKNPDKIISLYTGNDTSLRILFMDAKDKKVILSKNKIWVYGDNVYLGATDDAVLTWMKDPKHNKLLEMIRKDTYPDYYPDVSDNILTEEVKTSDDKIKDPVVEATIHREKTNKK